jgi:hypothetical protein
MKRAVNGSGPLTWHQLHLYTNAPVTWHHRRIQLEHFFSHTRGIPTVPDHLGGTSVNRRSGEI